MTDTVQLKKRFHDTQKNYETTKEKMKAAMDKPNELASLAQQTNDAWLEFKKAEFDYAHHVTLKKIGDLFGCH